MTVPNTGDHSESPFDRTLAGGMGIPSSDVIVDQAGTVYRLGTRVGTGGEVYESTSAKFTQPVVIKLFPHAASVDAAAVDAFSRAALQATVLDNPRIARTLEAGLLEDGTPYLVMERLHGETLKELMARGGSLSITPLLNIFRGVGAALSAAHKAGIIHGELRPDNIFIVDSDGHGAGPGAGSQSAAVKVIDFGAAHLTAALRQSGGAISDEALSYLSPEQMQLQIDPQQLDGRSDEYALAVIAHRLLAHVQSRRSPAVAAVLAVAMNQLAADRFESVDVFLTALEEAATGAALMASPGPTVKPMSDLEVTPVRGAMPMTRMARPQSAARRSSGAYGVVTQEFFEEGNRISEEAAAEAIAIADRSRSAGSARSGRSGRSGLSMSIPRNRTGRVVGLLGLGAVTAVAATAWAGIWNPLLFLRTHTGTVFSASAPATKTSIPSVAATPGQAADPAPASAPVAAAPSAAPAPAAAVAPAPAVVEQLPPTSRPRPSDPTAAVDEKSARPAARSGAAPARETDAAEPAADASLAAGASRHNRPFKDPLRGYVWSPVERRLVPADRAPSPATDAILPLSSSPAATTPLSSAPVSPPPAQETPPSPSPSPRFSTVPQTATASPSPSSSSPSRLPTDPPPVPAPPIPTGDNSPPPASGAPILDDRPIPPGK